MKTGVHANAIVVQKVVGVCQSRCIEGELVHLSYVILELGFMGQLIELSYHVDIGSSSVAKTHALHQYTILESIICRNFRSLQILIGAEGLVGLNENRDSSWSAMTPLNSALHAGLLVNDMTIWKLPRDELIDGPLQMKLNCRVIQELGDAKESYQYTT